METWRLMMGDEHRVATEFLTWKLLAVIFVIVVAGCGRKVPEEQANKRDVECGFLAA